MSLAAFGLAVVTSISSVGIQTNSAANPAVGAARQEYARVKAFLLKSADQMPAADYSFKASPVVRSFGEIIAHVAATQYVFCAAAQNQENPRPEDFEKTRTTKGPLIEVLRASFAYCDAAYDMTDARALGSVSIPNWGGQSPLSILILNVSHNSEHYGNVVTYQRMKGLVPPSSQQHD